MKQISLEEWLLLPQSELTDIITSENLAVMLSVDGTRRHYLIHNNQIAIKDYNDYAIFEGTAYAKVYELLFSLGIQTILTSILYPPNFQRPQAYVEKAIAMSELIFLGGIFSDFYKKWNVRARLYGDYDFSPAAQHVSKSLQGLANTLEKNTPTGERLLLLGYNAGSFNEELISRTLDLRVRFERPPSEDELRIECFPHGPKQINLYIGAGNLTVGKVLPPILDQGTNFYNLAFLALDLQEITFRKILYDYLFNRQLITDDFMQYSGADLQTLKTYYKEHWDCLVGLGQAIGPGIWYADHKHDYSPNPKAAGI